MCKWHRQVTLSAVINARLLPQQSYEAWRTQWAGRCKLVSFQQPTHNSLQTIVGKSVTGNDVLVQIWADFQFAWVTEPPPYRTQRQVHLCNSGTKHPRQFCDLVISWRSGPPPLWRSGCLLPLCCWSLMRMENVQDGWGFENVVREKEYGEHWKTCLYVGMKIDANTLTRSSGSRDQFLRNFKHLLETHMNITWWPKNKGMGIDRAGWIQTWSLPLQKGFISRYLLWEDKVQPLMIIWVHQVHKDARVFIRNKDSDVFANKLLKCSSNEGCKLIQKYF